MTYHFWTMVPRMYRLTCCWRDRFWHQYLSELLFFSTELQKLWSKDRRSGVWTNLYIFINYGDISPKKDKDMSITKWPTVLLNVVKHYDRWPWTSPELIFILSKLAFCEEFCTLPFWKAPYQELAIEWFILFSTSPPAAGIRDINYRIHLSYKNCTLRKERSLYSY